jgi:hypothetical protein
MRNLFLLASLILLGVIYSFVNKKKGNCNCDVISVQKIIKSSDFYKIGKFEDTLKEASFYKLSAENNRSLWYKEIEYPYPTRFTKLWNDYSPNNYRASGVDFIKYYEENNEVSLAFQFGPSDDLWAYHTFIIKKINDCFLVTRTYFRHARFTSKRYAIINKEKLDELYKLLIRQSTNPIKGDLATDYLGCFVDKVNKKTFYINFDKPSLLIPDKEDTAIKMIDTRLEVKELYEFVDDKIKWKKTYPKK